MSERHEFHIACRAGAAALNKHRPGTSAAARLMVLAGRLIEPPKAPKRESPNASKSEWPTMREELTRKALQAVQDANAARDAGRMTDRDLWFVIDALFDVTHGLIAEDMSALLYRARQELKEHAPK
ncbi:hypothetical protein ABID82_005061 [Methylobacterium sp. PvP062]|uniref:NTP pyrophosphohydrolase MazG putative catalytic core domain-containing protein n=1 Tax=Methylobacterium radiotolerans TaxID=31998 RepID=A0ABV2NU05_9HYPH|nr:MULTISPECIES: hypothetical protein [unclassified Methylobacterium]MBP2498375.1 hypothetical protein [Methylobacterium sp. PvP105]MBP2505759.1 hypothetical protein [Methylobacterium sp. PvP109]